MKLSPKAQAALDTVVERFKTGDLSPVVKIARLRLAGDAPAARWSFANQVLAYAQTGCLDCRGFRQWQQVGRFVRQGSRAAWILAPLNRSVEDKETGEEKTVLCGFRAIPIHPYTNTDGEEMPQVDYQPRELPPLVEVAERLGVKVAWQPVASDRLGDCTPDGSRINVGTHDPAPFFHELAHAVHAHINGGKLRSGQNAHQEIIADFTAAVLMELYDLDDRTGNAWQYIQGYARDPLTAIVKALGTVEKVLSLLLGGEGDGV